MLMFLKRTHLLINFFKMKFNTSPKDEVKIPSEIIGKTKLNDVSLVVYHNHKRLTECKPYYIGMLGIFIKDCDISYPINTRFEVEIIGSSNINIDKRRIPVVISSVTMQGVGLCPDNFGHFHNVKWATILNNVSTLKNNLKDITAISHKDEPVTD